MVGNVAARRDRFGVHLDGAHSTEVHGTDLPSTETYCVHVLLKDNLKSLAKVARRVLLTFGLRLQLEPDDLIHEVTLRVLQNPSCLAQLTPLQQRRYLQQMVRNEGIGVLRRHLTLKRGGHLKRGELWFVRQCGRDSRLSEAEFSELLGSTYSLLSATERQLCMFRRAGYSWNEIGRFTSMGAQAARKRYERAKDKVVAALSD